MQLLVAEPQHEDEPHGPLVRRARGEPLMRTPDEDERTLDLLGMARERVRERDALADRRRQHVLSLDERAEEPRLVAHQPELGGSRRELTEGAHEGPGGERRHHVRFGEALLEGKRARARGRRRRWRRADAEHPIVEPGVDHLALEAPLRAEPDAGHRAVARELQHRPLVQAQVIGELAQRHQAVARAFRFIVAH